MRLYSNCFVSDLSPLSDSIKFFSTKDAVSHSQPTNMEEGENFPADLTNKYTVSKVLGRGAHGEVRLGFRIPDLNRFAIKIIDKRQYGTISELAEGGELFDKIIEKTRLNESTQNVNSRQPLRSITRPENPPANSSRKQERVQMMN